MKRGLIVLGTGVWLFTIAISSVPADRGAEMTPKIAFLAVLMYWGGFLCSHRFTRRPRLGAAGFLRAEKQARADEEDETGDTSD